LPQFAHPFLALSVIGSTLSSSFEIDFIIGTDFNIRQALILWPWFIFSVSSRLISSVSGGPS
jgi:hypothetical protein